MHQTVLGLRSVVSRWRFSGVRGTNVVAVETGRCSWADSWRVHTPVVIKPVAAHVKAPCFASAWSTARSDLGATRHPRSAGGARRGPHARLRRYPAASNLVQRVSANKACSDAKARCVLAVQSTYRVSERRGGVGRVMREVPKTGWVEAATSGVASGPTDMCRAPHRRFKRVCRGECSGFVNRGTDWSMNYTYTALG